MEQRGDMYYSKLRVSDLGPIACKKVQVNQRSSLTARYREKLYVHCSKLCLCWLFSYRLLTRQILTLFKPPGCGKFFPVPNPAKVFSSTCCNDNLGSAMCHRAECLLPTEVMQLHPDTNYNTLTPTTAPSTCWTPAASCKPHAMARDRWWGYIFIV